MSFSENLQYLRKKQNLTQEQFAEQMEVSRQAVSKWESGQSYPEMEKTASDMRAVRMFHGQPHQRRCDRSGKRRFDRL